MSPNEKFAAFLNAQPFNWKLSPSKEGREAFSDFACRILRLLGGDGDESSKTIRGVRAERLMATRLHLLNLLYVRFSDPSRYVVVSLSEDARRDKFGYRAERGVITGLHELGLIELHKGFFDRKIGKGYRTRIRATDALMGMVAQYGIRPSVIQGPGFRSLIQLRASDGEVLSWPGEHRTGRDRMQQTLRQINQRLGECFVGLHVPDSGIAAINHRLGRLRSESNWVDFYDKRLYRVFNDGSPGLGGRFFGGWWQQIPSEFRRHIHIAVPGERPIWAVELDYGSMHPHLLYARAGTYPNRSIYGDWSCEEGREYAKKALLTLMNASSVEQAELALQSWLIKTDVLRWYTRYRDANRPKRTIAEMLPAGCPPPKQMLGRMTELNEPIAQFFCKGVAKELMYQESQIAESVMLKMMELGTVALPIHDSFLVPKGWQDKLVDAMIREFIRATGSSSCAVVPDDTELDVYLDTVDEERLLRLGREDLETAIEGEPDKSSVYWMHRRDWERLHPPVRVVTSPSTQPVEEPVNRPSESDEIRETVKKTPPRVLGTLRRVRKSHY